MAEPVTLLGEIERGWLRLMAQPLRIKVLVFGGVGVILGIAILAIFPSGEENGDGETVNRESIEYKLAVIDAGTEPDASLIARYEDVLDRLEPKCEEPRRRIADMAVTTHNINEMSPLQNLNLVNAVIPADVGPQPCADLFAVIATAE